MLKLAQFELELRGMVQLGDPSKVKYPDRNACNKLISLAKEFHKYEPKPPKKKNPGKDGLKGLPKEKREYISNLMDFFKKNVNHLVKSVWHLGFDEFNKVDEINPLVEVKNLQHKFVENILEKFVESGKFNVENVSAVKRRLQPECKEEDGGILYNKPTSFVAYSPTQSLTRGILEQSSQILQSNVDYITALYIVVDFLYYLTERTSVEEELEEEGIEEGEEEDAEEEKGVDYDLFDVLLGSKKRDDSVVRDIGTYFKKKREKGTIPSQLFKMALRRARNNLNYKFNVAEARTNNVVFSRLVNYIIDLKKPNNLKEIINVPELRENIFVVSSGAKPIHYNFSITPLEDVSVDASGVRSRKVKVDYEVLCPASNYEKLINAHKKNLESKKVIELLRDKSVKEKSKMKKYDILIRNHWKEVHLSRTFTLKESKNHSDLKENYSDIINLIFNMDTKRVYEEFNEAKPENSMFPHQLRFFLQQVKGTPSRAAWRGNYEGLFNTFLRDKNIQLDDYRTMITPFLNKINLSKVDAPAEFTLRSATSYANFKEFLLNYSRKDLEAISSLNKESVEALMDAKQFPSLLKQLFLLQEDVDMKRHPELNRIINLFRDYMEYFRNFVEERTLSPAMLRVTPGGNLEVISRWKVAKHQRQENDIRRESLSLNADLGVSELMTIDVRNNNPAINELDKDKYVFSSSDEEDLIKGEGTLSDPDLNAKLERLRDEYYQKDGAQEQIADKFDRIKHLWDVYNDAYAKYGKLLSREHLNPYKQNLLRKYYLDSINLSDKIRTSTRELAHFASGCLRYVAAALEVDSVRLEELSGFEVLGKGKKSLNKELSNWIRGLVGELLKYKLESINIGVELRKKQARYTSKQCHACGNIGRRGQLLEGVGFVEKGYGLAFKCSNPFCEKYDAVINADLNAARNIAQ